jgi:DNA-binding response OmpR family regulator
VQSILVVDDDENLRDTIAFKLEQEGFSITQAADGCTGLEKALMLKPDLVLVDLRLPGMNGTEVCKRLRSANLKIPIIVLSAVGEEIDKILLLEIGADDYVVKTTSVRELVARIRAVLRRSASGVPKVINFGENEIDLEREIVKHRGQEVKFTHSEYKLLAYFLENPDKPLTRDMILNSVWGCEAYPNMRTVDAHVVKLRQKLEADPNVPRHFVTVHGVGYRFLF